MINIVIGYFFVSLVVMIRCILSLSESILIMQTTRSREQKVTTRVMISLHKKNLPLSLVWPYQIFIAAKSAFLYFRSAK